MRRGHRSDRIEQLSSPEPVSDAQWRDRSAENAGRSQSGRKRQIRKRERPGPSSIWQGFAIAFLFCAIGALFTSATLSAEVAVSPLVFWVTAFWIFLVAALCFLAHWDVNRGRRAKEWEIEEVPGDE